MQAAARRLADSLAHGLSQAVILWAAAPTPAPCNCHLACPDLRCPDLHCASGGAVSDRAGPSSLPWVLLTLAAVLNFLSFGAGLVLGRFLRRVGDLNGGKGRGRWLGRPTILNDGAGER